MESKIFLFTTVPILAIIVIFGYINIQQERDSGTNKIKQEDLCKSIEYNGEDRIDLLFISSEDDARHYTEVLLNTEPYKSKKNYFNTRVIEQEVECKDYKGIAILCNTQEVQNLAKQCPNDYIIVVKQEPVNIRSSAYGNVISINKVHEDSVLIHEIGHAFGNLAEEYGGAKIPLGAKNCVSSCDKFNGQIDACDIECSESNYYRSISSGVMRTLMTSNYGLYNKEILIKLLEKNKPKKNQVTGNAITNQEICDKNILAINIAQDQDGQFNAETDNALKKGCPPHESGDGSLCFNEEDNLICYPDVIFTDSQDTKTQETLEGETIPYQKDTIFYVEQNINNPFVEITHDGNIINIIDTTQAGATACKR